MGTTERIDGVRYDLTTGPRDGNRMEKKKCFQMSHSTASLQLLTPDDPDTDARRGRNRERRQERLHASFRPGHRVSDRKIINQKKTCSIHKEGLESQSSLRTFSSTAGRRFWM